VTASRGELVGDTTVEGLRNVAYRKATSSEQFGSDRFVVTLLAQALCRHPVQKEGFTLIVGSFGEVSPVGASAKSFDSRTFGPCRMAPSEER
jgi:hypothetical protein